jgi:hypothetical protein
MRPISTQIFEHVISKPRLDSYKGYFHTKSINEAIGLYMWNCELATCFNALFSFFEIALRNNTHRAMSQFYSHGASNSDHWYDKKSCALKQEATNKIHEVRTEGSWKKRTPRNPAPNPDEIVSRVSFGFWTSILGSIDKRYASQIFPGIFPNHQLNATPTDWNNDPIRKSALAFIYELKDFRNRIAHHEPLWKFSAIKNTSVNPAILIVAGSNCYTDSLARFQRLLGLFDTAMDAINKDFYIDLKQSSWREKLDYLLSAHGLARYRANKHCYAIDSVTPFEFRQSFNLIVKNNQPIQVKRSTFNGLFIPNYHTKK